MYLINAVYFKGVWRHPSTGIYRTWGIPAGKRRHYRSGDDELRSGFPALFRERNVPYHRPGLRRLCFYHERFPAQAGYSVDDVDQPR